MEKIHYIITTNNYNVIHTFEIFSIQNDIIVVIYTLTKSY